MRFPDLAATGASRQHPLGLRPHLRSLRDANFRLYLFGLVVSSAGTYMQQVAEAWLVYRLTNSAFALGFLGFIVMLPLVPWTLFAGELADRVSRRTLVAWAQFGQVVPPLVLALLTFSGMVQVWHIVVVDLAMATLSALDQPARQALVAETAVPEDLQSAIALSAVGINAARVIGPAIAGLVIAAFGEAICFLINGSSFLAVVFAVVAMRLPHARRASEEVDRVRFAGTIRALLADPKLYRSLWLVLVVDLLVVPYQTLLPVFARDILDSGAQGLGSLIALTGVGAVLGSLVVADLRTRRAPTALALGLAAPLALFGFALARDLVIAGVFITLVSGAVVALKVVAYAAIQSGVADSVRGKVMSLIVLLDGGMPRIGGLGAGSLATLWGAPATLQIGAAACVVCLLGLRRLEPKATMPRLDR